MPQLRPDARTRVNWTDGGELQPKLQPGGRYGESMSVSGWLALGFPTRWVVRWAVLLLPMPPRCVIAV